MSYQHLVWLYLWVAPHVLLACVAALMFRKGLQKDFPIFFSYLLFEFLQFCLLFTAYSLAVPVMMYVKIDIFSRAGSIALRFGILQEMFEAPLAHNAPLRRNMGRILKGTTVSLVALALLFIGSLYYSISGHRPLQAYVTVEALNTAQCGLLALVFLWHRFLSLRMSPFVFGVVLGLGLIASSEPFLHALRDSLAWQSSRTVDFAQMGIYHGAVLIWLYYSQVREKITSASCAALPQLIEQAADLGRIAHL